ncbi:MAG TPA: aminotransferase class I/II-fold pyridoxal phosphate-dependent enzyme [Candidatus Bathyarchaeia archaeon]|nr:aminotransferase class I/II-fold pyridoxal phosphate-dependent enzyme [Candidatus Bathyarchaeia archaeon]
MKISQRVAGVEYAIRDIALEARKLQKQGRKITYLNIGDPLQYGFQPPQNVKDALIKAVKEDQNYYAASEGLQELREAIAKKENNKGLRVQEDDILVTNGVSEGLEMIMASIVEPGDEVLIPGPYYPPYASYVRLFGGKPVEFSVDLQNSTPDLDDIKRKISSKTVAICLISPNNPTGAVFNEKSLKDLIDVANEHDLYIVCDEIYDQIIFDEKFVGIGKVSSDSPVILLNGFSKVHLMSGLRIGYIAFNQSKKLELLRENVPKLARVRIATNLPVQYAALESLRGPQDYIPKFVSELKKRRDYTIKRLNGMHGISCSNPKGAFYAFPKIENNKYKSDKEFVLDLLKETGVLTVHGSGFGTQYGSGHFRMVFLPEIPILEQALDKIEQFMA